MSFTQIVATSFDTCNNAKYSAFHIMHLFYFYFLSIKEYILFNLNLLNSKQTILVSWWKFLILCLKCDILRETKGFEKNPKRKQAKSARCPETAMLVRLHEARDCGIIHSSSELNLKGSDDWKFSNQSQYLDKKYCAKMFLILKKLKNDDVSTFNWRHYVFFLIISRQNHNLIRPSASSGQK